MIFFPNKLDKLAVSVVYSDFESKLDQGPVLRIQYEKDKIQLLSMKGYENIKKFFFILDILK